MLIIKTAYKQATEELRIIRNRNREEIMRKRGAIEARIPELHDVIQALAHAGVDLARCVLDKNKDLNEIKQRVTLLQSKKCLLLTKNGYNETDLDELCDCPICGDTGFVGADKCSCLIKMINKKLFAISNMGDSMKEQTFDNFDFTIFDNQPEDHSGIHPKQIIRKVYKVCREFAETFDMTHQNMLICGGTGTGKTYLSSCMANHVLSRGMSVYYQTAGRMFDALEAFHFNKADYNRGKEISDYINEAQLLIIDDLGTEFVKTFTVSTLFDIVNTRLLHKKSTVINTNLSLDDIIHTYSDRIHSRIVGEYEIVRLFGKDLRY